MYFLKFIERKNFDCDINLELKLSPEKLKVSFLLHFEVKFSK